MEAMLLASALVLAVGNTVTMAQAKPTSGGGIAGVKNPALYNKFVFK